MNVFAQYVTHRRGRSFPAYDDLWHYSVDEIGDFWWDVVDYFDADVRGARPQPPFSGALPDTQWFPDTTVNYARNLLRQRDDGIAVVLCDEGIQDLQMVTRRQLFDHVASTAAGLRQLGVEHGDRVVAFLPNRVEALVGLIACASIGAVWSICSPDFGADSVLARFEQLSPKAMIATRRYTYGGRTHDRSEQVKMIVDGLPSLTHVVLVGEKADEPAGLLPCAGTGVLTWEETQRPGQVLEFTDVAFGHPLWTVYSSGTTGAPKGIQHSHGGVLLEHYKLLGLHLDMSPDDVFMWFSTTGWIMWNILVGGLLHGATVVLYDGSPGAPDLSTLWRLAERLKVTHLGMSPAFMQSCRDVGVPNGVDLTSVRVLQASGSPLSADLTDWASSLVPDGAVVGSMSGGTDVATAFVGPIPIRQSVAGVIDGACLGVAVDIVDPSGQPIRDSLGELVVRQPMPSMPIGFVNDPDGSKYRDAYFSFYPGIWRHGDWALQDEAGRVQILGRSDATLNRGGVRMGASDFYQVVEAMSAIDSSLVVDTSAPDRAGGILLFVKLHAGFGLTDELESEIRTAIREQLSPRHVPDEVIAVADIPVTRTGKKLEVPVKRILQGAELNEVMNLASVANAEALTTFVELARREKAV